MKNLRQTGLVLLVTFGVGTALGACGGRAGGFAASSGPLNSGDQAFLHFTACMRGHGVHMADPYHRAGHAGLTLDLPEKTPATLRAYSSCNHLIVSVMAMKQAGMHAREDGLTYAQRRARQLGLLHYAHCMRARGIPMLDPDATGSLSLGNVPGAVATGRYTPLFRRADGVCRRLLPAGVTDNGTGP